MRGQPSENQEVLPAMARRKSLCPRDVAIRIRGRIDAAKPAEVPR